MEASKKLAQENGNQASMLLGELTGDELLVQNGNQAGFAMGELTGDELLAQNGNQAGVGVAEYFDELDKRPKILTFTANEDGSSVGFIVFNDGYDIPEDYTKPSLQYSTDGGKTWQDYDLQISDEVSEATAIELDEGGTVMFKGINENLAYYLEDDSDWLFVQAYIEGSVAASGDITSLINGIGGNASLAISCYRSMFERCTSLTQAPALPATTLAESCYSNMFNGCTGLTLAPDLPATTLANHCYHSMFSGCTGLTQAPVLLATTLADYCYASMFKDCTGLTQAPALPATTLAEGCYNSIFSGCTGLTQAPVLLATTLAQNCYSTMFNGCRNIASHNVVTLNNSTGIFTNNSSCTSFTVHAETPPTIASNTITGLKADCIIYVPAASVDAYKAAQYWSARASYIQAMP